MLWSVFTFAFVAILGQSVSASVNAVAPDSPQASSRPNVVFILTDDQDLEMGSLDYMPLLKKYMYDRGTSYRQHFCTISLCCPSRVSLWTGRLSHNTNVTDIAPPYGGYDKFISQGLNDKYLPVWLQEAGYNTFYSGKLFNSHSIENYDKPFAAGWNGSEFLLDPYQYQYYTPCLARNHDAPIVYNGSYCTDLIAEKAYGFLDNAVDAGTPFFLGIAPIASHAEVTGVDNNTNAISSNPQPAQKYKDQFPDAIVPRTPNFNPDTPSGAAWVYDLPKLNDSRVALNDEWYRDRLRTLQSVDEIVEQVIERLEKYNLLNNTYIFYTTDNGYHIGQHRMEPGKTCPWESDVHIPFVVRGPGIAENASTELPTSHTDIAPTIFEIMGIPLRPEFDGLAIPLKPEDFSAEDQLAREHVGIEFWNNRDPDETGPGLLYGKYNTTYKALRMVGDGYSLYYSVWCTENQHELYDMTASFPTQLVDPYQMNNLFAEGFVGNGTSTSTNVTVLGVSVPTLATRLDSLMMVLKSCVAESCREPWAALVTDGSITNLKEALDPSYDEFFASVPRVSYSWCDPGYIIAAEGPQFQDLHLTQPGAMALLTNPSITTG